MLTEQLPRIDNYSPDLINRKLKKKLTPFIFSGAITEWLAFQRWDMQFFKQKFGDLQVTINYNLPDNLPPYLHDASLYTKQMRLTDFIDEIPTENKGCYLAQSEINIFNGLENDFNFNELIPTKKQLSKVYTYLWIGSNTRSGLHYDFDDNFLVQIYGVKKVFLVAPNHARHVYPLPENFLKSQVNPMNPDITKYPNFDKVTVLVGEIKAGDVLFIPKGWYHYIYSPSESISLNCWYGSSLSWIDLLISFYRSGMKTWLNFTRDFFWHGVLARPAKERLFCSPPLGKLAYDSLVNKINQFIFKK